MQGRRAGLVVNEENGARLQSEAVPRAAGSDGRSKIEGEPGLARVEAAEQEREAGRGKGRSI
jgi:hypothetical protein